MSNPTDTAGEHAEYFVPHSSWYPIWIAAAVFFVVLGAGNWLNDIKAGVEPNRWQLLLGLGMFTVVMYTWFAKVIEENNAGLANAQLKRSYVWGMSWFIFSEAMFFAAFFGALFYARTFSVAWLGGEGDKGLTGTYLWPEFTSEWPVVNNPDAKVFTNPGQHMGWPGFAGLRHYLPFWNTVILLTSSVTVHMAHIAIKNAARAKIIAWLWVTVLLGLVFIVLQGVEYYEAYSHMGLTLGTGIYGSTFFLLTGFHGFHVTLGTLILAVQLARAIRGHFTEDDQFGFESASWYWHFVDVVWVGLFIFVYIV